MQDNVNTARAIRNTFQSEEFLSLLIQINKDSAWGYYLYWSDPTKTGQSPRNVIS